jgi:hypothetical protein
MAPSLQRYKSQPHQLHQYTHPPHNSKPNPPHNRKPNLPLHTPHIHPHHHQPKNRPLNTLYRLRRYDPQPRRSPDNTGPVIHSLLPSSSVLTNKHSAFHREMNAPISESIDGLQQALTAMQTDMLQNDFIGSQAVLRTIRASSSLENAQTAFGRFLNLPGGSAGDSGDASAGKRDLGSGAIRLPPAHGAYYTHAELWGRDERARTSEEGKAKWRDGVVQWEERRGRVGAEDARVGRPFVV